MGLKKILAYPGGVIRTVESSAYMGGTETIVWNRSTYQSPLMVRTDASTNNFTF